MELLGALSNQELQARLQRLSDKLDQVAVSNATPRRANRADRILRPGSVLDAVTRVLAAADVPMRTCKVRKDVADLLAQPVSASSVKGCLAAHAQGNGARFERTARGYYRLRGPI
jgi:hypothetical protein